MTAAPAAVYLLPPRPRARDWPVAGACAGLLLALAELLVAAAGGVGLPAPLALLLVASDALLVAVPCAAIGLGVRALGARPSHSALVVGVLGPLLLAAVAGSLVARGGITALGLAAALAAAVGVLATGAARLADRAERAGIAASGPLVWGATALLLVGSARLAAGEARPAGLVGSLAFAAALAVGGTVFAHEVVKRRGSAARMGFGRLLVLLAAAALLAATVPLWLPWLLAEREPSALGAAPANLLAVVLPAGDGVPTVDALAWRAAVHEGAGPGALRERPGGGSIAGALTGAGYATAAIVRDPARARPLDAAELDARPGGRGLLAGPASWIAAAPLLRGPGAPLLRLAGQDTVLRSPAAVAGAANRWPLAWRGRRAAAPFFLFVDLRGTPDGDGDGALAAILDRLAALGVAEHTLVAVAVTGPAPRVVVRPAPLREAPPALAGTALDVAPGGGAPGSPAPRR